MLPVPVILAIINLVGVTVVTAGFTIIALVRDEPLDIDIKFLGIHIHMGKKHKD